MADLQKLLEQIYGLELVGIRLGLKTPKKIMETLKNPQNQYRTIHIAGTNGKGSVAAFLASILKEAGFKIGLYTSPHILHFNERFQINNNPISDNTLESLIMDVRKRLGKLQPTFFEFTTALAFEYFAQQQVDIAIIEVGMGGDMDATNVITPELSIITNIGYDHTHILGHTLLEIAQRKAGIIKKNVPLITAEKNGDILSYFKKECEQKNAAFFELKKTVVPAIISQNMEKQAFRVSGNMAEEFQIQLLGDFQIENACLAIAAAQQIPNVKIQHIQKGLMQTQWPGRLQILSTKPLIIVDGAHNEDGMQQLAKFVKPLKGKDFLVLGISEDKPVEAMVERIVPLFQHVIVTEGLHKPMKTELLATYVKKYNGSVKEIKDPKKAVAYAKKHTKEIIVVAGSLYVIPAAY